MSWAGKLQAPHQSYSLQRHAGNTKFATPSFDRLPGSASGRIRNSGPGLVKYISLVSSAIPLSAEVKVFKEFVKLRAQSNILSLIQSILKLLVHAWPVQFFVKSLNPTSNSKWEVASSPQLRLVIKRMYAIKKSISDLQLLSFWHMGRRVVNRNEFTTVNFTKL